MCVFETWKKKLKMYFGWYVETKQTYAIYMRTAHTHGQTAMKLALACKGCCARVGYLHTLVLCVFAVQPGHAEHIACVCGPAARRSGEYVRVPNHSHVHVRQLGAGVGVRRAVFVRRQPGHGLFSGYLQGRYGGTTTDTRGGPPPCLPFCASCCRTVCTGCCCCRSSVLSTPGALRFRPSRRLRLTACCGAIL